MNPRLYEVQVRRDGYCRRCFPPARGVPKPTRGLWERASASKTARIPCRRCEPTCSSRQTPWRGLQGRGPSGAPLQASRAARTLSFAPNGSVDASPRVLVRSLSNSRPRRALCGAFCPLACRQPSGPTAWGGCCSLASVLIAKRLLGDPALVSGHLCADLGPGCAPAADFTRAARCWPGALAQVGFQGGPGQRGSGALPAASSWAAPNAGGAVALAAPQGRSWMTLGWLARRSGG